MGITAGLVVIKVIKDNGLLLVHRQECFYFLQHGSRSGFHANNVAKSKMHTFVYAKETRTIVGRVEAFKLRCRIIHRV